MKIRNIQHGEIGKCLDLSLESIGDKNIPEFYVHVPTARKNLAALVVSCKYFRVMEKDGEIVSWMAASSEPFALYSPVTSLKLVFYHSVLKGYSAAISLLDMHEDMFRFAEGMRLMTAVTGPCPHLTRTFNRILAKDGWIDYNEILVKKTRHYRKL